ncbi:MAG: hypothetical protein ACI3YD_02020 [Alloprevotella sp.]
MKATIEILKRTNAAWLAAWLCLAAWMFAADCVAQREHRPGGEPYPEMRPGHPDGKKGPRHFQPEKFKQDLQAYVTREAKLTEAEARKFFPVFFEMKEKQRNLDRQKSRALRTATSEHATEADCQRVIEQQKNLAQKMARMESDYYTRLCHIVGARKLVRALEADRKFGRKMFKKMTDKPAGR